MNLVWIKILNELIPDFEPRPRLCYPLALPSLNLESIHWTPRRQSLQSDLTARFLQVPASTCGIQIALFLSFHHRIISRDRCFLNPDSCQSHAGICRVRGSFLSNSIEFGRNHSLDIHTLCALTSPIFILHHSRPRSGKGRLNFCVFSDPRQLLIWFVRFQLRWRKMNNIWHLQREVSENVKGLVWLTGTSDQFDVRSDSYWIGIALIGGVLQGSDIVFVNPNDIPVLKAFRSVKWVFGFRWRSETDVGRLVELLLLWAVPFFRGQSLWSFHRGHGNTALNRIRGWYVQAMSGWKHAAALWGFHCKIDVGSAIRCNVHSVLHCWRDAQKNHSSD